MGNRYKSVMDGADTNGHQWTSSIITKDGTPALRCEKCKWVWKAHMSIPTFECGTR